jgi:hypothetical protein
LLFVEDRRDDPRPAEQRFANRTERDFLVRALLAKVHGQRGKVGSGITPEEGGCFITTPDDLWIQAPDGKYEISRNARGELALVTRSLTAAWYEDAFEKFLSGLIPSLDHLAHLSNTPIVIDVMECRDEANHITAVSYRMPYGNVVLSEGTS